jgi:Jacalin-like lectin domain
VGGYVGTLNNYTILKSLKLVTNLRTYGPYGAEDGQSFEISVQDGKIIGFHARSGQFVDAIGVYVKVWYYCYLRLLIKVDMHQLTSNFKDVASSKVLNFILLAWIINN